MEDVQAVEWDTCMLEPVRDPAAETALRRSLGLVPHGARYFLGSPWIPRAFTLLDLSHLPLVHISGRLSGLLSLVVSQDNACRYCYAATRTMLRILGFPEARIRQFEETMLAADPTSRDGLVLDFGRRVSRGSPLPGPRDAAPLLDAGFSAAAVCEVAFLAAVNVFYNRLSTLPALPPAQWERMSRAWWTSFLWPLRRHLKQRRGTAVARRGADAYAGPFAEVVGAFDGLPLAERLHTVIDAAWTSPVLDRRAKGLVFAVVARGLACARSEAEATRLLGDEGVAPATVAAILDHLDASSLGPVEAALVPFARETIRYRPADVQRRARALRAVLDRAQLVELIGLAALANMLCRLGVAADLMRAAPRAA